ncbi:hypothetical protein ACOMHN_059494 [Nucella lapillus]
MTRPSVLFFAAVLSFCLVTMIYAAPFADEGRRLVKRQTRDFLRPWRPPHRPIGPWWPCNCTFPPCPCDRQPPYIWNRK